MVNGPLRGLVDARLELGDFFGEFAAQFGEIVAVDLHAAPLHPADDRDQGLVDALVHALRMLGGHARLEAVPQAQGDVGILRRIFGRFLERHLVEGDLLRARPAQRLEADAVMVELRLGEVGQIVAEAPPRIEIEAHQHRVVVGRDVDAGLVEHHPVVLEVVPDLEHRRIFEQRLQPVEHELQRKLVRGFRIEIDADMADRNVAGAVRARSRG